ncbi:hypothetical protein [Hugenholtzia roseola]|uniref:hypothetical protein n=1 Tax=Hugenholtzia roseola TaxID=1002 RepID=UPI000426ECB0|nr:hypothetical protein [Hugenholtzia roseola]
MLTQEMQATEVIYQDRFVEVLKIENEPTLICKTKGGFIPSEDFKIAFGAIGEYIKHAVTPIRTLIFDKSTLRTFDQNAMTWYHIEWKPKLLSFGLRFHKKILPQDDFFRKSVEIGKARIKKEHPQFNFETFKIEYYESLDEALAAAKIAY